MKWKKIGRIYNPHNFSGWISSHAQGPTVLAREDYLRIYFAARPEPNISLPTYIDVDIKDPSIIIAINKDPILKLGPRGSFDEFGIIPCYVMELNKDIYLYYTGWSRGTTVTYILSIGLAISKDGGHSFNKIYEGPIVDRTKFEPYMTMAPFILKTKDCFHMWYASGIGFQETQGKYEPQYIIKYASSVDAINWQQPNIACIKQLNENESNTRPTVLAIGKTYHMWFCYRGSSDYRGGNNSYRIGYALSTDLINWERRDADAGITVSDEGWDSELITYPYVATINNQVFMFYNGNGFGNTGFGYAVLQ